MTNDPADIINGIIEMVSGPWPYCSEGHDDAHIPLGHIGICLRCHHSVSK